MSRFVQLTMVTGTQPFRNTIDADPQDNDGEDDGIVASLPAGGVPTESTSPVMLDVERIRNFYPRKPDRDGRVREGTRITFADGGGMAVTELFDSVKALVVGH